VKEGRGRVEGVQGVVGGSQVTLISMVGWAGTVKPMRR
jgi:hypothetical protein